MKGRILIIAGSDPSGGAGIQADLKTVTALGGYGMTAITALTVQDTKGVYAVSPVSPDLIRDQIKTVVNDIGVDAIKIGMMGDKETAYMISGILADMATYVPKVLDPVLVATSGDSLAGEGVETVITHDLMPQPNVVITPNVPELARLAKTEITDVRTMMRAGQELKEQFRSTILLKGGHLEGDEIVDVLMGSGSVKTFKTKRVHSTSTHGTGCTLSSAIATGLGQGLEENAAIERAIAYVRKAIKTAPGYGKGHGPLNHGHTVQPLTEDE